jgi:hypothetical protein
MELCEGEVGGMLDASYKVSFPPPLMLHIGRVVPRTAPKLAVLAHQSAPKPRRNSILGRLFPLDRLQ